MSSKHTQCKGSGIVYVLRHDGEYTSDYLPTRNGASLPPFLRNPKMDVMRYLLLQSCTTTHQLSAGVLFF